MSDDRLETFRKWTTLLVFPVARFFVGSLRPLALLLKATITDQVRKELATYETIAASDARWKVQQDYVSEVFKHLESELSSVRDRTAISETNYKILLDAGNRLSSIETTLDLFLKDRQRDRKLQGRVGPEPKSQRR